MKYTISIVILAIATFMLWGLGNTRVDAPMGCTLEAKICPDGTSVGRTGPNCEFAPCPEPDLDNEPPGEEGSGGILPYDSGVQGVVWLGPTCPVEIVGDRSCEPRPYPAKLLVRRAGSQTVYIRFQAEMNTGTFIVDLPPGDYVIEEDSESNSPPTRVNSPVPVRVVPDKYTNVRLDFDSGIR